MSQPDYIDVLRIAKSMGIKPSPKEGPEVPSSYEYSKKEIQKMRDELEMCQMIIQHFDNEFRKMQQSLNQVNKNMQDIALYRLTWMTGWEDVDEKEVTA